MNNMGDESLWTTDFLDSNGMLPESAVGVETHRQQMAGNGTEDHDMASYLDFSDMQLDFSVLDGGDGNGHGQPGHHGQHPHQHPHQHQHNGHGGPNGHGAFAGSLPPTPVSGSLSAERGIATPLMGPGQQPGSGHLGSFHSPSTFQHGTDPNSAASEEALFTPLLSPAVTPFETGMQMPVDYSTYFSPLSSPALEAQHSGSVPNGGALPPQMQGAAKIRRRQSGGQQLNPGAQGGRVVKASPQMRPLYRRKGSQSATVGGLSGTGSLTPRQQPVTSKRSPDEDESYESSISPMGELSMPPPELPSTTPSASAQHSPVVPVTPATLMNMSEEARKAQAADVSTERANTILESVLQSSRRLSSASQHSSGTVTPSAGSTPRTRPIMPDTKRRSVSISPALRPRISPSIKPLLPEGMTSQEASQLLASKSNYQNIVDGKHNELGLSYPQQLSLNLTSKRTSHKLAEQGRRNRINNALAELNGILSESGSVTMDSQDDEQDDDGGDGSKSSKQQFSKANTVEMAIVYIRKLQGKVDGLKSKLAEKTKEVEDLRAAAGS
ncbi:uncharacterized protein V1510DRAFT_421403 [Dipodascopsis tothii]|uniref:uncharacterized protein n=1 Tax=Dipodascopsis tothii TaxID=44089 RepID=UPI0034CEF70C